MAVRSAFALGLHREESMGVFPKLEQKVRRNLWRTLFVFDKFLAASLGRPTAIAEEDCSKHALDTPEESLEAFGGRDAKENLNLAALDASVKISQIIGITLKKIYSERKISTTIASEIAYRLKNWNESLPPALRWQQMKRQSISPRQGVAILHINLLHCHSIILLTRPFLLYILNKAVELRTGATYQTSWLSPKMESFAQTCIEASQHTLAIAQAALDAEYLQQCNPFVMYVIPLTFVVVIQNGCSHVADILYSPLDLLC
jgi:hypothetical protein